MALGDGSNWDETVPTDATIAIQIDDYNRDLRKGLSARMRFEHEWPASQSATSEGGKHKYITLQDQASKPTIAGTQTSAIYEKTNNLWFENSGGTEIQIVAGTAVGDGKVLMSATDTSAGYLIDKLVSTSITASGTGIQVVAIQEFDAGIEASVTAVGSTVVAFAITFSSAPSIACSPNTKVTFSPYVSDVTTTGFTANNPDSNVTAVHWTAINIL